MLSVFTKIVHVSNISRPEHLLACLDHLAAFTPREMDQVRRWASSGKRYSVVVITSYRYILLNSTGMVQLLQ